MALIFGLFRKLPSYQLKASRRRNTSKRRPCTLSSPYVSLLGCSSLCLAVLVGFLYWRSWLPDCLVERKFVSITQLLLLRGFKLYTDTDSIDWSGGPLSTGIYTGQPFNSTFIRASTYNRPPQGLVSSYYDCGVAGRFSQKNTAQRLGRPAYWVITFLPMVIAILYGRMWKAIDDDIKRIDIYYRLYKEEGTTGARSLCLNYHVFWVPLSIFQAVIYQHWQVAISSLGSVIGTIIIPLFLNYVFYWEVYSGAALDRPGIYSWQVALVDRGWAFKLIGALIAELFCSAALFYLSLRQVTFSNDIRGIAGLLYLIDGKDANDLGLPPDASDQPLSDIEDLLGPLRFRLIKENNEYRLMKMAQVPETSRFRTLFTRICHYQMLHLLSQPCRYLQTMIKRAFGPIKHAYRRLFRDKSFLFNNYVFAIWILFLSFVTGAAIWITVKLYKNATDGDYNYVIPIDANICLALGIFIQVSLYNTSLILVTYYYYYQHSNSSGFIS